MNRTEIHNGYEYTYEDVDIGGYKITLSANDQAWVSIFLANIDTVELPLVHKGRLTVCLTEAGLDAIEEMGRYGNHGRFRLDEIEEIEINGNANDNLCGNCEGCENNESDEEDM
jgi:hypothetical protein